MADKSIREEAVRFCQAEGYDGYSLKNKENYCYLILDNVYKSRQIVILDDVAYWKGDK